MISSAGRLIEKFISILISGGGFLSKLIISFYDKISPVIVVKYQGMMIKLSVSNRLLLWRAVTFESKEPETLKWIQSFGAADVFYDVGANIGLYSVYAGLRGVTTYSFEPESQNFAILCRNIYLNKIHATTIPVPVAVADRMSFARLSIPQFISGAAMNQVGAVEHASFVQGILTVAIDGWIETYSAPFPTHIKIDVDGVELLIIQGALKTLSDKRLKSLLIEIDEKSEESQKIISHITNCGLRLKSKSVIDIDNNNMFNYIFTRA